MNPFSKRIHQVKKSGFRFAERNAKSVLRSKIRFWIHRKENTLRKHLPHALVFFSKDQSIEVLYQAPVVQTMDCFIHRINHYPGVRHMGSSTYESKSIFRHSI